VIAALALSIAMSMPAAGSAPGLRVVPGPMPPIVGFPTSPPPSLDAAAWMLWSVGEDATLGSEDPDTRRAFASITKLMSAILAVENADLGAEVVISPTAGGTPIGYVGQPDVRTGETWTMEELLILTLVGSGNKASAALAEGVTGDLPSFVALMNEKAAELGLDSTEFTNPHGLDAEGHLSTPRDLIDLGRYSLRHPKLLDIMRIKEITFVKGGREITISNTNRLVGRFPGYAGLKTGDTAAAGQVLLSYTDTGTAELIGVVLGSTQRRLDTRDLLAWGLDALGPREHFYAMAGESQIDAAFPDWYRTILAAVGPLEAGDRVPDPATPGTQALMAAYRELLPTILGGTP
jgi:D-alanyl-D-alanine carboxypeptidase (penicillin-binding protein 5/6)